MYREHFQEDELMGSLSNFEQSLERDETKYFEVHEFEFIIDHYLSSNDVSNSKKAIQKGLKIHPNNQEIQKRLAQVNNVEGFHESAIDILEHSFTAFGTAKDLDYYLILGEAYLGTQKPSKASKAFDKALELSEDERFDIVITIASLYQQEGYFEQVIQYLQSVEEEDSTLLFDIGLAFNNLLDYSNAIKYLERFLPTAPFSIDAWYYIAKAYSGNGNYDKAEDALMNTIALDPDTIVYQYELAKVYVDQEKYIDALELYKDILSLDKNVNHSIFLSIGDISYNLEQFENAQKNYEIALRLNPDSPEAFHSLGQVDIEFENYESAKSNIQKAIAIDADRPEFFISLGTVNQLKGDLIGAEFSFIEATKLNPSLDLAWSLLIDYYFFVEKPEQSLITAFQSIEKVGEDSKVLVKIAASFFDLEDHQNGLTYLEKALSLDSEAGEFFLDYYSIDKTDSTIKNLINLFQ